VWESAEVTIGFGEAWQGGRSAELTMDGLPQGGRKGRPGNVIFHSVSRRGGFGEWHVGLAEISLGVDDSQGGDIDDFFHGRAAL